MIYSSKDPVPVEEVEDMLYWYQFTIEDVKSNYEKGDYFKGHLIAMTVLRHIRHEFRLHRRKDIFDHYFEDPLFIVYSRAVYDLKHLFPLIPSKKNILIFCKNALDIIAHVQLFISTYINKS